jgi:hypothetical protein
METVNSFFYPRHQARMYQITHPNDWWETGEGKFFCLKEGEIGIATREGHTSILKIGNGVDIWADLPTSSVLESGVSLHSLQQFDAFAGTLGYYYKKIDFTNKKIYLTTE